MISKMYNTESVKGVVNAMSIIWYTVQLIYKITITESVKGVVNVMHVLCYYASLKLMIENSTEMYLANFFSIVQFLFLQYV